jgi:subtilase family serine protease
MVQFDNQDFTVSLAETSIVANASSPAHVKVTIGAVGTSGWSGTVTLTVTASSGLSGVLTSTTLSGTGTVNLDVTASSGGTYTVTVTAASGSLSHTSQQLTVGVPQPAPSPGTPVLLYAIVGVLVAVVVAGVIVARTRRKKTK